MESKQVGAFVRDWRELRRFSQLQLAVRCDISSKHLSYVETGKSRPSPEMIVHLCEHLDVPLRIRNVMRLAAGYAPRYPDHRIDTVVDSEVQTVVGIVLESQSYPAAVVDHQWNVVAMNSVSAVFTSRVAPHLASTCRLGVGRRVFDAMSDLLKIRQLLLRGPCDRNLLPLLLDRFG
jgi:transcriptional regulator with XRE-family HTH domain